MAGEKLAAAGALDFHFGHHVLDVVFVQPGTGDLIGTDARHHDAGR
jgi:hypothetical protein